MSKGSRTDLDASCGAQQSSDATLRQPLRRHSSRMDHQYDLNGRRRRCGSVNSPAALLLLLVLNNVSAGRTRVLRRRPRYE